MGVAGPGTAAPGEEPLDGAPPWSLISDQGFPIEARRVLAIGPGAWWRDGVRPTPKYPAPANTLNRAGLRRRHHGTGGGPSETDVSELMVIPAGLPSGGMAVTIPAPVACWPKIARSGSIPLPARLAWK